MASSRVDDLRAEGPTVPELTKSLEVTYLRDQCEPIISVVRKDFENVTLYWEAQ